MLMQVNLGMILSVSVSMLLSIVAFFRDLQETSHFIIDTKDNGKLHKNLLSL